MEVRCISPTKTCDLPNYNEENLAAWINFIDPSKVKRITIEMKECDH